MNDPEITAMKTTTTSDVKIYYYEGDTFVCDGYNGSGWYFWNDTFSSLLGPYSCDQEAKAAYEEYFDLEPQYYHEGDGIIQETSRKRR
jgi:hypothetical protein